MSEIHLEACRASNVWKCPCASGALLSNTSQDLLGHATSLNGLRVLGWNRKVCTLVAVVFSGIGQATFEETLTNKCKRMLIDTYWQT